MGGCTKCGGKLDLNPGKHLDLNAFGIFCESCAKKLAKEGRALEKKDRKLLGDDVVNERLRTIHNLTNASTTAH